MNTYPEPFIQNHVNWCWAVAAKIVGINYLKLSAKYNLDSIAERVNAVTKLNSEITGLRLEFCGNENGHIAVDALQYDLVLHACNRVFNPVGILPEDDEAKARAIRYLLSAANLNELPRIETLGTFSDMQLLVPTYERHLVEIIGYGYSFIGNYMKANGCFHSVVLTPSHARSLELYDPWDGYKEIFSMKQIFKSGFLTNQGLGIIQWIQYISPS